MISKDVIKTLIAEYQQLATNVTFQVRPYVLEEGLNYVFVGLRRAGKSYLMYQFIHQLQAQGKRSEEMLYFNFEDERIASMVTEDLDLIKACYEEMYDYRPVFFLDEIQVVPHWEKFTRRLADQGYRLCITGSNARMLSQDIATTLGGRFRIMDVFPYSYGEYLTASGVDTSNQNLIYQNRTQIARIFEDYFYFGGLPELVTITDKRGWLGSLYQKIFFGDLVSRYQIRNDFALRILIRKLAETVGQPVSFNRLSALVSSAGKKISTDTVIDYLVYLKETWLLFPLENIVAKLADKESNKKYYFIDNGLLNLFLIDPQSALLENLVAITLRKRYSDQVYYYLHQVEVDFYVPEASLAIQACYRFQDPETRKREVKALCRLADRFPVQILMVITKDEELQLEEQGKTIIVIPIWKWLLTTHNSETLKP